MTIYTDPILITPASQPFSFTQDADWTPRVVCSDGTEGFFILWRIIPDYGPIPPVHVVGFDGTRLEYTLPTSPAGQWSIVPHLSAGQVQVYLPEPSLALAIAIACLGSLRRRRGRAAR